MVQEINHQMYLAGQILEQQEIPTDSMIILPILAENWNILMVLQM